MIIWANVARAAYEKYCAHAPRPAGCGWLRWDELAPENRQAWVAAVQEAYDLVIGAVLA